MLYHFHEYIRRSMEEEREFSLEELLEKNPGVVLVTNELGYGVVPADRFDREYREKTGRICCQAAQAAGELRRKVRVDMLWLEFTAGGEEAAQTALSFGYVNSAIGMIWPLLDHNFNIKDHCIRTRADFQRAAPAVYLRLEATLTLGQALVLAIKLLARFSAIYGAYRREQAPADNTKKESV